MNLKVILLTLAIVIYVDGKRSLSGRGGSSAARGTSRRTSYNPHPAPTSLSYPQPAPKPSLFGWQEKTGAKQSKPKTSQTGTSHSYPSSPTGLSGNKQVGIGVQSSGQSGHSYPASNGLSGSPGSSYPQQSGTGISNQQGSSYPSKPGSALSGSGVPPPYSGAAAPPAYPGAAAKPAYPGAAAPPAYSGAAAPPAYSGAAAPPPYSGAGAPPSYPGYNGASYQSHGNDYQHPQPPPPYSNYGSNYGGHPSYHASNGQQMPGYGSQSPGYFGNYASYGNRGSMSRSGSALTGVGIAGAGVGTLLTGLALWNLARSTGNRHHTVIYDNRGQPVAVAPDNNQTALEANSMLADLVNCSLTISNDDKTEVLAIPCAIATSFTPDADIKTSDNNNNATDNTKCTVTVVNKSGQEFMTTIPCSILLNTAAENNVTETPINVNDNVNGTVITPLIDPSQPPALSLTSTEVQVDQKNTTMNVTCTPQPGEVPDPINPCFSVTHNLTVIPLQTTEKNNE